MADSKVVFETELDTTGLVKGLKQLQSSSMTDLEIGVNSDSLAKLGSKLGRTMGIAVVAEIAKAIGKTGIAFDAAMSQVAATMGTTVKQLQPLQELAEISGKTTAFTAVESAEALNYFALAGWEVADILTAFPDMLSLAAAGNLDLSYATDIVTDTITAMGLSADDTGALVDQMAKAASRSNTSVKQLGQGMLAVGATARTLEGGTEELATTLGLLADNGIKGAQGGRQLRNIINSLASPTAQAQEVLSELSISAFDAEGNFRPLSATFSDLRTSLDGMSDQQRMGYLDKIFNKEDYKSVNALLGTTVERWTQLQGAIGASEGAAALMAKTQLDNLGGDIKLFKSAAEGLALSVYRPFEGAAREVVQTGTGLINGVNDLIFDENAWDKRARALGLVEETATHLSESKTYGGGAGREIKEKKSFWDWILPSAGAEELTTYYADTAGAVTEQLNAELQKAFADGDPQVQAALMAGLTPTEGAGEQAYAQQLTEQIGDQLSAGFEAQREKLNDAMSAIVTAALASLGEIQTAGDELAAKEWTPTIAVEDAASAVIESVKAALAELDGSSATVHISASGGIDGSHANGLDYVPYDNYLALLHKGERVLTADENLAWQRDFASSLVRGTVEYANIKNIGINDAVKAAIENATFVQNNTFNQPVQTPDEFAQTMRLYATYGLAGGE